MKIISNNPCGYEQWEGITTNYMQLKTIYFQRSGHKLWEDYDYLCDWIEALPYFKEWVIQGKYKKNMRFNREKLLNHAK